MRIKWSRYAALAVTILLLAGFCLTEANAQKRRTKKSRRVTNPVTTARTTPTPAASSASTSDPQIISTAADDDFYSDAGATTSGRRTSPRQSGGDATQNKVDKLSAQVNVLTDKLTQMEQQQRALVDLERLSRAEARAEALRTQLRDVMTKETELQARAEQLNYDLQPTNIERTLAVNGSTRPEDLRETRRRQLESEKTRVQTQLTQLATNRARLETAIANAEAEADRLRARVDAATEPAPAPPTGTDVGIPSNAPTPDASDEAPE